MVQELPGVVRVPGGEGELCGRIGRWGREGGEWKDRTVGGAEWDLGSHWTWFLLEERWEDLKMGGGEGGARPEE